jgi:hypothetical protein
MSRGYYESGLGPPDATEIRLRNEITAQIQKVTQALLDNPEAVAILKRVGLAGDFAEGEEEFLDACSGAKKILPEWSVANKFIYRDYWAIAQALARRVGAGMFTSAMSEDAHAYVFERTYAVGKPENWNTGAPNQANYADRQRDFKISFDEFYAVLKEYAAWDQIPDIVAHARQKAKEADDSVTSDQIFADLAWPLTAHEKKIFRKHGFINDRMSVRSVEQSSRMSGLNLDDPEAVRAEARHINLEFIKGIRS